MHTLYDTVALDYPQLDLITLIKHGQCRDEMPIMFRKLAKLDDFSAHAFPLKPCALSVPHHTAKFTSGIGPSSGALLIFFRKRAKVAFLASRSSA